MIKFTYGASSNYNEIYRLRKQILDKFPGAFIIAFKNDVKMDVNAAIKEFKAYNLSIGIFYFNPEKKKSFLKASETVMELAPDAVLLAPLFHKETLEAIQKFDSKNIIVNTYNNQVESSLVKSFVGQDLFRSGRVAAKLLDLVADPGQIAIIHIDENYKNAVHMQEKERGFRSYFEENE